jgi:hypothetical protein
MGKPKIGSNINTPLKGQISRYYQRLGVEIVRGSATATARELLKESGAAVIVSKIGEQVASGKASRANRRSSGAHPVLTRK